MSVQHNKESLAILMLKCQQVIILIIASYSLLIKCY